MIELRALSRTYAGSGAAPRRVFDRLSTTVARGEYVAIVGASGIGKSTLLNLIAGLERPDSGTLVVDGVDFASCDDDALTALRRTRMGFVFQAFHILPYLSVAANVALPLALQRRHGPDANARVAAMLDRVGLGGRGQSRPAELSGGELQRVAIARALVHRPALVLADEPTGNLDPATARQVIALLRDAIKGEGATGVIATHSRRAAASADRVLRLDADGLHEHAIGAGDDAE
ncbi:MAG TPA: ABC transporter ATP-binding protein [Casimicrobiaceae bacterium]|nr:ABC transporter ATP-binding protein [Casimicrobiaceae bacterium]